MNIIVSQHTVNGIPQLVSFLKSTGLPQLGVENCKRNIISAIMNHFTSISSNMPGYCYYDIPGVKYRVTFSYKMFPEKSMVLITGMGIKERLMENKQASTSKTKHNVIRLTESEMRHCMENLVRNVLMEAFDFPHGLNEKDVMERFSKKLSSLYLKGKISEDDFNELAHYFLYFRPNYANGHKEDEKS